MPERSHLAIGEVLSLLRDEFPDVTISKIRFLESQGLVDPERTPSGYRKFYDHDVERLRWILRQQREKFLPLKVIKVQLSEQDGEPVGDIDAGIVAGDGSAPPPLDTLVDADGGRPEPGPADQGPSVQDVVPPEVAHRSRPPGEKGRANATPSLFAGIRRDLDDAAPPDGRQPPERGDGSPPVRDPDPDSGRTYTAEELSRGSGATAELIEELRQFGLIAPETAVAGTQYFDDTALAIARAAAAFAKHGVEVRHLRVWRNAADREADLFQQVVLPLLRQRNPQARRQALDTLDELTRTGAVMRDALLSRALREIK